MRTPASMLLVADREIRERLRSRGLWIMTAITAGLVVLMMAIPVLIERATAPQVIGLAGAQAQRLGPGLVQAAAAAGTPVRAVAVTDAQTALREGTVDVALSVTTDKAVATVRETLSPQLAALLSTVVNDVRRRQALQDAGLTPAQIRRALTPVPVVTVSLEQPAEDQAARLVAGFAAGLLLYVILGIYGAVIANGVAQEKTSRTAEVLVAVIRPRDLLNGKVLGIGVCALLQMGVVLAAAAAAGLAFRGTGLPGGVWQLLPAALFWFLLGYALYSFAFAAAGATVSRQEETQIATAPVVVLLVGSFGLLYALLLTPNAWWIAALSLVPPLTPVLMPARLALGSVPAWQFVAAVLLTLAAIWLTSRLAARVYAAGIVQGGTRLTWRRALRRHAPRPPR